VIKSPQTFAIFSAALVLAFLANTDVSQAQIPMPVYVASAPVVTVQKTRHHHRTYSVSAVPVQVGYASYYAPQVPVVPMAYGPVPTVSAYYVPTAPVVQTYYAPVITTTRRHRRTTVSYAPAVVQPAVIHPVYWFPY
jgi:hypothetical protein